MIFWRIVLTILLFVAFIGLLDVGITERKRFKKAEKEEKEANSQDDKLKFQLIMNLSKMYRFSFVTAFILLGFTILVVILTIIDLVVQ